MRRSADWLPTFAINKTFVKARGYNWYYYLHFPNNSNKKVVFSNFLYENGGSRDDWWLYLNCFRFLLSGR